MKELDRDLGEGNKISEVFMDEKVFPVEAKIDKKIQMEETSFGRQKNELYSMGKRL